MKTPRALNFIKSQKQNNHKNIIIIHLKKNKTIFLKKKTFGRSGSSGIIPKKPLLPESSFGNLKGHPEEPFFRNSSGRTLLPEFFRKTFGFFRNVFGIASFGSSGRTSNGSSGRLHREPPYTPKLNYNFKN